VSDLAIAIRTESTSAAGAMSPPDLTLFLIAGGAISLALLREVTTAGVTSGARPIAYDIQTTGGSRLDRPQSSTAAIYEVRRITGLSWDQLARLFGVSRRSVHFWANGKALNSDNEEHLYRLLATAKQIDRGSVSETRAAILRANDRGVIAFDLLAARRYDDALMILSTGQSRARPTLAPLSAEARKARAAPPPNQLLGAVQGTAHMPAGGGRPARTRRAGR